MKKNNNILYISIFMIVIIFSLLFYNNENFSNYYVTITNNNSITPSGTNFFNNIIKNQFLIYYNKTNNSIIGTPITIMNKILDNINQLNIHSSNDLYSVLFSIYNNNPPNYNNNLALLCCIYMSIFPNTQNLLNTSRIDEGFIIANQNQFINIKNNFLSYINSSYGSKYLKENNRSSSDYNYISTNLKDFNTYGFQNYIIDYFNSSKKVNYSIADKVNNPIILPLEFYETFYDFITKREKEINKNFSSYLIHF